MVWPSFKDFSLQQDHPSTRFPEYQGTIAGQFYFLDPRKKTVRPAFLGLRTKVNYFILDNLDLYREFPKKTKRILASSKDMRKYVTDVWHGIEDIVIMCNPFFYTDIKTNSLKKSSWIRLWKYTVNTVAQSPFFFASKWKEFALKMSMRLSGLPEGQIKHFVGFHQGEMNRLWPSLLGEWVRTRPLDTDTAKKFSYLIDKSGFPAYPNSFTRELRIECEDSISHLMRDLKDYRKMTNDNMYKQSPALLAFREESQLLTAQIASRIIRQKKNVDRWFVENFTITHFSLSRKADYMTPANEGGKLSTSLLFFCKYILEPHGQENTNGGYDIFGIHTPSLEIGGNLYTHLGLQVPKRPETYNVEMKTSRVGRYIRRRAMSTFTDERLPYNIFHAELLRMRDEGFFTNETPPLLLWERKEDIRLILDRDMLIPAKAIVISERGFKVRVATSVPSYVTVITQPLQVVLSRVLGLFPELQDSKGSIQSKISNRISSNLLDLDNCLITDLTDASNMLNQYLCFDIIWKILLFSGFHENPVYKLAFDLFTMQCYIEVDVRNMDRIPSGLQESNGRYGFEQTSGLLMGRQITRECLLLYVYVCYQSSLRLLDYQPMNIMSCIGDDIMIFSSNPESFLNFTCVAIATDSVIKEQKTKTFIGTTNNSFFTFGKRLFRAKFRVLTDEEKRDNPKLTQWNLNEDESFVIDSFLMSTICRKESRKPIGAKAEVSKLKILKDFTRYYIERNMCGTLSESHNEDEMFKRIHYMRYCVDRRFLPRLDKECNMHLLPSWFGGSNYIDPHYHLQDEFDDQLNKIPMAVKKLIFLHNTRKSASLWTSLLISAMADMNTRRGSDIDTFMQNAFNICVEMEVFGLNKYSELVGSTEPVDFKDASYFVVYNEEKRKLREIRSNQYVSVGQFQSKLEKITDLYSMYEKKFSHLFGGEPVPDTNTFTRKHRSAVSVLYQFLCRCPNEIFKMFEELDETEVNLHFFNLSRKGFFVRRDYNCFVNASALGRASMDIVINKNIVDEVIALEHPEDAKDRIFKRNVDVVVDDTLTGNMPFDDVDAVFRTTSEMLSLFTEDQCYRFNRTEYLF